MTELERNPRVSTKRKWIAIAVAAVALVALAFVLLPAFMMVDEPPAEASPRANFEERIRVDAGMLVLPRVAGAPATIHFNVTNLGDQNDVYVREVAIEHTSAANVAETAGPDMRTLANVPISPGETVSFGPQERQVVLSNYDSTVVPGATVEMKLTFSNSETITVPLTVRSSVGQGGAVVPDSGSGSVSEPPE